MPDYEKLYYLLFNADDGRARGHQARETTARRRERLKAAQREAEERYTSTD